jgi:hypothetical protein
MHVTSYDIMFGNTILYPLKVTLDSWEETTTNQDMANRKQPYVCIVNEVYRKASNFFG